ncbi:MAG: hypothetical protein BMS9Abin36_1284 [Gammaproteobacteria bacterium]|nr:MAG: hypothetical protein BMS9Abin36_1284 [Gammaproteobacteria bacterium]
MSTEILKEPDSAHRGRLQKGPMVLLGAGLFVLLTLWISSTALGLFLPAYSGMMFQAQLILIVPTLILALLLTRVLYKYWLRPLQQLQAWTQRIRAGDLETKVPLPESGELRDITRDINNLSRELSSLIVEMDGKVRAQTEHIAAKSRSLEILYDIATDLSIARNLDEMLEQFLETLMVLVDARAATVRLLTDDHKTYMVASLGLSETVTKQEQWVDVDRCLCGHISKIGGIGIQYGIEECNQFLNCAMVEGECKELIVVPLQYRDRILGVYNLFLARPSSELGKDVRDLLNSIGKHLGLAIEKSRLDDKERRLSIMEERNMIGNELHDSLAQSLVSMRLQAKMLGELLYKKDLLSAQNELRGLRSAIDEAHDSLRELLANFKSRMDGRGLVPTIKELALQFREETGIAVFLQNEWHEFSFTPTQEVQVFRIIQEALTNIRKHSNAGNVRIMLHQINDEHFDVMIEDDGLGMSHNESSVKRGENIGITIMTERAQRIGGKLSVESEVSEGTRVNLTFPAKPGSHDNEHIFGALSGARTPH